MTRRSGMVARTARLALLAGLVGSPASAEEPPLSWAVTYTVDAASTLSGGSDMRLRGLDNLDLEADAELAALLGWRGARAHVHVLNNLGARPNDAAGTLQGVDNIEVAGPALRLFEAWIEQDLGGASLRVGLYDLNSEFYATEAAGLLIAPPFGIGSELAASGPNGPSIFPSTALALRFDTALDDGGSYLRLAAVNARASTLGDSAGVDLGFRDGVLAIGEAGLVRDPLRLSAGLWGYSRAREDIFETDAAGIPLRHAAWGGYGAVEANILPDPRGRLDAFLRIGFSEGHTTPYTFGTQAGLRYAPAFASRPDSAASLGFHYAGTNRDFRAAGRAAGANPAGQEYAIEATYADRLTPLLTLQPDLQLVFNPGGRADIAPALVAILRLRFEFASD